MDVGEIYTTCNNSTKQKRSRSRMSQKLRSRRVKTKNIRVGAQKKWRCKGRFRGYRRNR